MKLNEFSFTNNFTMLQCTNREYELKVKLKLKYPMHLSPLMSKKFNFLKIRKPNRVLVTLSYCLTFIHKSLCLYLKYLSVFFQVFTIIIFSVVTTIFCIVCFKNFFNPKMFVCLGSKVVSTFFSWNEMFSAQR